MSSSVDCLLHQRAKNKGVDQGWQVVGEGPGEAQDRLAAPIVLSEDIEEPSTLQDGIVGPRRRGAAGSQDANALALAAEVEEGRDGILELQAVEGGGVGIFATGHAGSPRRAAPGPSAQGRTRAAWRQCKPGRRTVWSRAAPAGAS